MGLTPGQIRHPSEDYPLFSPTTATATFLHRWQTPARVLFQEESFLPFTLFHPAQLRAHGKSLTKRFLTCFFLLQLWVGQT